MAEDDDATSNREGPADEPFPLLIAVTSSPAERIRLAERLDGIAPLLLVADLDELRRLIATPRQMAAAAAESATALVIDSARSSARCGEREVDLTRLEHDLLTCLITEPVRVWSYAELHRSVWGDEGRERKADVQSLVKRLRRKLHDLGTRATIDVVRGVGLRLTDHQQARVERA
ncbi:winged helix-turn-helix domain-containing protein [Micromonospora sp. WMMD964]|uniref:winged helix-turn-helix domain-containing protein n=1 Tax=Micromonospora sp. WMMD964 TaxID=3016091 RepID=UPI00249CAF9C|nr:winged helix-turn-helix domain-containing protein [Micromonospora sp. WMMD964]WFE99791.1 winged helix-turn-helix domain-containing protein [Micromonospora sp. WMMD964]